jgi:hypothetical protein
MLSSAIQELRGWVLLLIDGKRHYFIGKTQVCRLNFVPAIAETDYETRNVGRVPNYWMCEKALEQQGSEILRCSPLCRQDIQH